MRDVTRLVVGATVLTILAAGCSETTDSSGGDDTSTDCVTSACKLATIEEGTYVSQDDPLVTTIRPRLMAWRATVLIRRRDSVTWP